MNSERPIEEARAKRLMAMGQMAASLAHEIRNPLGSMELYCTLLKKDLKEAPSALELAEQIHAGIKVLDRIISNCLQFSRDLVPRQKRLNDSRTIIDELFHYARPQAEQAEVALTFEEQGSNPIQVDPYLVNQALLNVVLNAIDAAGSKENNTRTESGRVLVKSDRAKPGCWAVVVIDNGPGIASEDQERIFDPFFTTKNGGTGLGLAIVHSIVTAHRGSITVESKRGHGTAITLNFGTVDF